MLAGPANICIRVHKRDGKVDRAFLRHGSIHVEGRDRPHTASPMINRANTSEPDQDIFKARKRMGAVN